MDLYPAIDLRGGRCVRLYQGDYRRETAYGTDPVSTALEFADAGATWVHVVDLDAARTGEPVNRPVVAAIAGALAPRGVSVQSGGGVRDQAAAEELLAAGVRRIVLGTAAMEQPELVRELAAHHEVAVALDLRGREVAVRGWVEGSSRDVADVLEELADAGVAAVNVTDISRDGTMAGPDVEGLSSLVDSTNIPVIASGGVGTLDDLVALASTGVAGVIVGRALYEGRFTVAQALSVVGAGGR
ncbi:MAG: hisA [Acidimicrobiales bacterium]|jgi:phosphoribosylformimino-5-aminoimidazole carboxamide ribotide isomerase|nr:hisA [Acidimicrobiales bacterium]